MTLPLIGLLTHTRQGASWTCRDSGPAYSRLHAPDLPRVRDDLELVPADIPPAVGPDDVGQLVGEHHLPDR